MLNLNEIKKRVQEAKEQGRKLISHQKKMEEYYEEWETVMAQLDKDITQAAKEHGLTVEEVAEYDALSDIFD